jgi:hypothetical protein
MQKWEYCAVVGIHQDYHKLKPYFPGIWHFTENGIQATQIKGTQADEIAKTIAQLGEQGWEMAGSMEGTLYFKRPQS